MRIDGGVAIVPGLPVGGYGRLGSDLLISPNRDGFGPVWGIGLAHEYWVTPHAGGYSAPLVGFGGFRTPTFFATLGGGFNLFTVDTAQHLVGEGIFSPRALARGGVHVGRVYIAATAEVQRRWRWGLDDITLFQAGITVGVTYKLTDGWKIDSTQ